MSERERDRCYLVEERRENSNAQGREWNCAWDKTKFSTRLYIKRLLHSSLCLVFGLSVTHRIERKKSLKKKKKNTKERDPDWILFHRAKIYYFRLCWWKDIGEISLANFLSPFIQPAPCLPNPPFRPRVWPRVAHRDALLLNISFIHQTVGMHVPGWPASPPRWAQ